jgi:hypothetical protein
MPEDSVTISGKLAEAPQITEDQFLMRASENLTYMVETGVIEPKKAEKLFSKIEKNASRYVSQANLESKRIHREMGRAEMRVDFDAAGEAKRVKFDTRTGGFSFTPPEGMVQDADALRQGVENSKRSDTISPLVTPSRVTNGITDLNIK